MEPTLLMVVIGLFVAVLFLKAVVGVAVRYILFLAVALLVFEQRYGPDIADWLDGERATQMAIVAGIALVATKAAGILVFRDSRWRFVLTPVAGIILTVLAAKIVLP